MKEKPEVVRADALTPDELHLVRALIAAKKAAEARDRARDPSN